jgi:prepilin-type processing-associated H-X9-DG protein
MINYAKDNNGAIMGNAWSTGAFLVQPGAHYSEFNCPDVCQVFDWMAPAARFLGFDYDYGPTLASRGSRYNTLCRLPVLTCPENDMPSVCDNGEFATTTQVISYNTSLMFHYKWDPGAQNSGDLIRYQDFIETPGYFPNITRVGDTSSKIFIADGAKWVKVDGQAPTYELTIDGGGTPGGQYSDYGPWSQFTRSYQRKHALLFALRHGMRTPDIDNSNYRMNAAFFDGHVESIDGSSAANPRYWVPAGTIIPAGEFFPDLVPIYASSGSMTVE